MTPDEQISILSQIPDGVQFCHKIDFPLTALTVDILQVNLGKRCNLSCKHCHVAAGPERTESMDRETVNACLEAFSSHDIGTLDITGGSPEMNPHLPLLIETAAGLGRRIIIRSNLVIFLEAAYSDYIGLYAENSVEVVASLPAWQPEPTDRQRGSDTFAKTIEAMRRLNEKGYGRPGSGLVLNLVHNPVGAYLPGSQEALAREYRRRLGEEYGVSFNDVFCLTNCPIGRYLEFLVRSDNYNAYMHALIKSFNRTAVANVMCRRTLSVGWDGALYDCDFNQMLELGVNHGAPADIFHFDLEQLASRRIVVGNHCFSCTAGAGSSCQGALTV